jgi:exosortase A-associated hydrolase 2
VTSPQTRVRAFHLPAASGQRFAVFHSASTAAPRGAFVYVHPFAEEMNKTRRMAALQARAFAAAGYAVLQLDLHGCGDSSGEFDAASWDGWRQDVALAAEWLARKFDAPLHLWALRAGALLAIDAWCRDPSRFASALLWNPVVDGRTYLTQFLRIAVARDALNGTRATTSTLRAQLERGEHVDVAGYALSGALARGVEAQHLAQAVLPTKARVHWIDVRSSPEPPQPVAAVLSQWRSADANVEYSAVAGDAFWSTVEIVEVPALIEASTAIYARAD